MRLVSILLIGVLLVLVACTPQQPVPEILHPIQQPGNGELDDDLLDLETLPVQTLDNGTKFLVHPSNILAGGPPKDGLPSLDNPQYELVRDVDWLDDNDTLLFMDYNGVKKAYPTSIIAWHKLVNDYAAGIPIVITYCPICQTGVAYERIVNNLESEFGSSGYLFSGNSVMYDRLTNSYWTQVEGVSIYGEESGEELKQIPLDVLHWYEIVDEHPDALILNRDTGFDRDYSRIPYTTYYTDDAVWFPEEFYEFNIHSQDVVYGVFVDGKYIAYRESDADANIIATGEKMYWYEWYALHPDTELFEK